MKSLKRGDWVVMKDPQLGTWRSAANVREGQVLKVPRLEGLSEVNAATMMVRLFRLGCEAISSTLLLQVNPATAYCLLSHFVPLEKGQWVIQNGANSAVRYIGSTRRALTRPQLRSL